MVKKQQKGETRPRPVPAHTRCPSVRSRSRSSSAMGSPRGAASPRRSSASRSRLRATARISDEGFFSKILQLPVAPRSWPLLALPSPPSLSGMTRLLQSRRTSPERLDLNIRHAGGRGSRRSPPLPPPPLRGAPRSAAGSISSQTRRPRSLPALPGAAVSPRPFPANRRRPAAGAAPWGKAAGEGARRGHRRCRGGCADARGR